MMTQTTSGLSSPVIILGLFLLALGCWLCYFSIRRKRKGNEPHCRKCEYQLTGIITEQACCPECGHDLSSPHAIIKGKRTTHWPLLWAGILLILITVAQFGRVAYQKYSPNGWIKLKPTSWVIKDAVTEFKKSIRPTTNTNELLTRLQTHALSKSQLTALADQTIKLRTNMTSWRLTPAWRDVADHLLSNTLFSQAQMEQLIDQCIELELKIKPVIRRKRYASFSRKISIDPIANGGIFTYQTFEHRVDINGQEVRQYSVMKEAQSMDHTIGSTSGDALYFTKQPLKDIADGSVQITYLKKIHITFPQYGRYTPFDITKKCTKDIKIVPEDVIVDQFINDPIQADNIEKAWQQTRVEITTDFTKVWLDLDMLPVKIAMKVIVVDQDKEHEIGNLLLDENQPRRWHLVNIRKHFKLSPDVQVELRPSQDVADQRPDLSSYWGQPLRREKITVNAPYNLAFNMDRSVADAMSKAVSIRLNLRSENEKQDLYYVLHNLPVGANYTPLFLINGKWQRNQMNFYTNPKSRAGVNFSYGSATQLQPGQKTISIRLEPNVDWEADTQDFIPPWGYAIEFLDLPLPEVGQTSNQLFTGKVILPDEPQAPKP